MITKIVTARGVEYQVGDFVFGKSLDSTVSKIEPYHGPDPEEPLFYSVNMSDGGWVEVKDVVEVWQENDS